MTKTLFEDFSPTSAKEWTQKIQVDLKGDDFNSLITHTNNGIDIKPFYHLENTPQTPISAAPTHWYITEKFTITHANQQKELKASIEKGTESLWLFFPKEIVNLTELLANIALENIPIFIEVENLNNTHLKELKRFLKKHKNHQIRLGIDIVGNLAKTGNWLSNLKQDHDLLLNFLEIHELCSVQVAINTQVYQHAGATQVQQLAYSLAHVNEYLNFITQKIPNIKSVFKPLFKTAISTNYFFETAKLIALRDLYATLAEAYDMPEYIEILAFPSTRNKTLYDYNVNMLRSTTECMSAVLGNANFICNMPYDEIFHHQNNFGRRIARNQLLILKNESYFDKVENPTDGTYYITHLVEQLSEKALDIFKQIEKSGGFLAALKAGTIQRKVKESAEKEQAQFDKGEITLIGTNKYQNPEDKMAHELEKSPFLQKEKRKTLIEPIIAKRLAEKLEQTRLNEE
ncbi:MAG: methylmalonyl-CoA mutase subunit beta [Mesonia hippocampi]|uniref:methylmalonyl-CoA mutase subunit beta n=1 Tax=Mesonia hippocampi TaxID=1628250 RepID=UPI003F9D7FE3